MLRRVGVALPLILAGCGALIGIDDWQRGDASSAEAASSADASSSSDSASSSASMSTSTSTSTSTASVGGGGGAASSATASGTGGVGVGGAGGGGDGIVYSMMPGPVGDGSTTYPDETHDPDAATPSAGQLLDAVKGNSNIFAPSAPWVGWYSSDATITFDLGQTRSFTLVTIGMVRNDTFGVHLPSIVNVSSSVDGSNFGSCATYTPSSPDQQRSEHAITLSCDGRYLRLLVGRTFNPHWFFLDEVEITTTP